MFKIDLLKSLFVLIKTIRDKVYFLFFPSLKTWEEIAAAILSLRSASLTGKERILQFLNFRILSRRAKSAFLQKADLEDRKFLNF